jgi:hypothetical protein
MRNAERKPRKEVLRVIEKVIQKAYVQAMDTKFRSDWRRIVGWVDAELVGKHNTFEEGQWDQIRQDSEICLNFLSSWYKKTYLPEQVVAFVDIAISKELPGIMITGQIPVIRAFETPVILVVSDVVHTEWSLYNDISIRGLAWLAAESLEAESMSIESIHPGKQGGYNQARVTIDKKGLERTKKMIEGVAANIAAEIDFPSITKGCESCPFKRRCNI